MRFKSAIRTTSAVAAPARGGRRNGLSAIYFVFLLIALVGFVSMAVDIGRIRLARNELQVAADAGARAGADSLPISTDATIDAACDTAENNGVIDAETSTAGHLGERINPGVALVPAEDLEFGIWGPANRTFTILTDDAGTVNDERRKANAVHVTGRRITERNNPIPLIFAPVLGVFSSDIEREAIAYITGGPDKFGFIGLDYVRATGNKSSLDSVLPPSKTRRNNGWVGSNGDIDLGNADVYGDVRPGIGKTIYQQPNSLVTGWAAQLDYKLVYPVVDSFPSPFPPSSSVGVSPPSVVQSDGSIVIKGKNVTIQPGTYYFSGKSNKADPGVAWDDQGDGLTTIKGPATIYLNGDFLMSGKAAISVTGSVKFIVNGNIKQRGKNDDEDTNNISNSGTLYFALVKAGSTVNMGGSAKLAAHVYAPLSDVVLHGTPGFTGWIVGKTLTFLGGSQLHYDESRNNNVPYRVTLVK